MAFSDSQQSAQRRALGERQEHFHHWQNLNSYHSTVVLPVRRFLRWWRRQLIGLVPAQLQVWWRSSDESLMFLSREGRATLHARKADGWEPIYSAALPPGADAGGTVQPLDPQFRKALGDRSRVLVALQEDKLLRRTIRLPIAVEENLRATLGFELDRYTPFARGQANFDFRVVERDTARRRLVVELVAAPVAIVNQAVDQAAAFGLSASGVVLAHDAFANTHHFNLLGDSSQVRDADAKRWPRVMLAGIALALMLAALAVPIFQKRHLAIALIAPLAKAQAAARAADARRDELSGLVEERNALIKKKGETFAATQILDELSIRLPDDTYLMQLDFDGKTVQLQGESGSASRLIELIEESPMFTEVGFKAQLLKIQGTPYDRFHIGATLERTVAPAPAHGQDPVPQASADPSATLTANTGSVTRTSAADNPAKAPKP